MYNYELLCLDGERTRSVWLQHPEELNQVAIDALLHAVTDTVPAATLRQWAKEAADMHQTTLDLGWQLKVAPEVMQVLESRSSTEHVTFASVLDRLVDRLCTQYGFRRLIPTAVVVRFGPELLAA